MQVGCAVLLLVVTLWLQFTRSPATLHWAGRVEERDDVRGRHRLLEWLWPSRFGHVVDVVARLKPGIYDRVLLALALSAPLALFALNAWRASLETWYAPMDGNVPSPSETPFARSTEAWLTADAADGAELILVLDRDCPCSNAARAGLQSALAQTSRKGVRVTVRYLDDAPSQGDPAWRAVLRELPATPTLLAIDGRTRLRRSRQFREPVHDCGSPRAGVTVLEAPRTGPILRLARQGLLLPSAPSHRDLNENRPLKPWTDKAWRPGEVDLRH